MCTLSVLALYISYAALLTLLCCQITLFFALCILHCQSDTNDAAVLPGYRHVRLRNSSNQPLQLSSLFIYTCLEEDSALPNDITLATVTEYPKDEKVESKKATKGLLSKFKDVDIGRMEKEVSNCCLLGEICLLSAFSVHSDLHLISCVFQCVVYFL